MTMLFAPPSAQPETTARPLILVVDDKTANIRLLSGILQDAFEVCMATNAAEALLLCEQRRPDLVLLDVVLPGTSGIAVCRHIKACMATRDTPVMFIDGAGEPDRQLDGFDAGGADYIVRPFDAQVLLARIRAQLRHQRSIRELKMMTLVDPLTAVGNRRHFDAALDAEWRRCQRAGLPIAVLMIDVDRFKAYNDLYGHQRGDFCLRAIAGTLQACLQRASDCLARYGGEEFAVALPDAGTAGALSIAAAMLHAVRALELPHAGADNAFVSVSVGVAALLPTADASPATLIALADAQLYRAKRSGRGRACADRAAD